LLTALDALSPADRQAVLLAGWRSHIVCTHLVEEGDLASAGVSRSAERSEPCLPSAVRRETYSLVVGLQARAGPCWTIV
jgi:hypothetical protein